MKYIMMNSKSAKIYMKLKTFSIEEEKLEVLRKLSKETGIPQSLLIRRAIDNLLKDREKLKDELFGH